MKRLNLQIQKL